jgi:hypothetical protein
LIAAFDRLSPVVTTSLFLGRRLIQNTLVGNYPKSVQTLENDTHLFFQSALVRDLFLQLKKLMPS